MRLTQEELYVAWLSSIEGIGLTKFTELVNAYGSPKAVFDGAPSEPQKLIEVKGIGRQMGTNVLRACTKNYMDAYLDALEKNDIQPVTIVSSAYPDKFSGLPDMPITLYCKGDVSLLKAEKALAVVGTRAPSHYGREVARNLCFQLANAEVCVVSGMARGIDGEAHRGALDAEGKTIAVLGNGCEIAYPRENTQLYERIYRMGLIVSEYPPGTPPRSTYFPRRNRLISALAQGVLVVEAGEHSGSSITVNHAIDQGKDVFAVPGNITSPNSVAANRLIKEGCQPVTDAEDILSYYGWGNHKKPAVKENYDRFTPMERMLLKALEDGEKTFDELFEILDMDMASLITVITQLETSGAIRALPGRTYGKAI